jgi:hypothetical protein
MSSTKQAISLKTINKFRKTSSKKKSKPRKPAIIQPTRFLDPYTFHRFFSDMIIPDKLSYFSEAYLSLNSLLAPTKHIFSIEEKKNYFQMVVIEKNIYRPLPLGLLCNRLRTMGDQEACYLAQILEEYMEMFSLVEMVRVLGHIKQVLDCLKLQNLRKIFSYFEKIHKNAIKKEEWDEWKEKWMENKKNDLVYYMIYGNFKKEEGGAKIQSIGINQTFKKLVAFYFFF